MARVTITVEREGGSTIEIAEQSAMPLFTDEQCGRLVQEAFLRALMALGVSLTPSPPDPEPPAAQPAPEPSPRFVGQVAGVRSEKEVA